MALPIWSLPAKSAKSQQATSRSKAATNADTFLGGKQRTTLKQLYIDAPRLITPDEERQGLALPSACL